MKGAIPFTSSQNNLHQRYTLQLTKNHTKLDNKRHKRHFVEKRAVLCGVQRTTRVGRNVNSDLASQSTNKTPSIHDTRAERQTLCNRLMQKCNHCQLHLTLSSWRARLKVSSAPQMLFVTHDRYVHEGHCSAVLHSSWKQRANASGWSQHAFQHDAPANATSVLRIPSSYTASLYSQEEPNKELIDASCVPLAYNTWWE